MLTDKDFNLLLCALGFYKAHRVHENREIIRLAIESGEWNKKEVQDLFNVNEDYYAQLRDKLNKMQMELNYAD